VGALEKQEAELNRRKEAVAEEYRSGAARRISDDAHPQNSTETVHRVSQPPMKAQKAAKKAAKK